ncbi:MAG TPA: hypothetical protein DCF49_01580 [Lachnospiraceae bacterium]|nr:hypothetical protein [Lachnospiraceae bacterium]
MKTEVWLTVTGEQRDTDGRSDRNEGRHRASYEYAGGVHIFEYEERDPDSGAVTGSRMEITESSWTITRSGALRTVMEFAPGDEKNCEYDTVFGSIPMTIVTSRMGMRKSGDRFRARVSYSLRFGGGEPMDCAVMIKAEPI